MKLLINIGLFVIFISFMWLCIEMSFVLMTLKEFNYYSIITLLCAILFITVVEKISDFKNNN